MKPILINLNFSKEIQPNDINDLVVTALEGGINGWCGRAVKKRNPDGSWFGVAPEDQDKVEYASDLIGYGGTLILHDAESEDKWELNLEKMVKGIQMHCTKKGMSFDEMIDNYDADDADCIVQYALFDELTFC